MSAADAARDEAELWVRAVRLLTGGRPMEPAPTELEVVGFDPAHDLERRARRWGHAPASPHLVELCRFGAALALAEAEAWDGDDPVTATRAFEDRRFLAADRVLPWAVPWACEVDAGDGEVADVLLDLGEVLRTSPRLSGTEGIVLPGHDGYGPLEPDRPPEAWLRSLLSGAVLTGTLRRRLAPHEALVETFRSARGRWEALAAERPGTAGTWADLAARAARTLERLSGTGPHREFPPGDVPHP